MKEKADLADDVLMQGIVANPKSVDLIKALAALYERKGEYAHAIEWWQKILIEDPQNQGAITSIDALKKKLGQ